MGGPAPGWPRQLRLAVLGAYDRLLGLELEHLAVGCITKAPCGGQVPTRGRPAPVQADYRWVIERTHVSGNQYGKLR